MPSAVELEAAPRVVAVEPPLGVVTVLFRRLVADDIAYCHWKSNEHLGPATRGETDLDVLVDAGEALRLARALAESGYKRFIAAPEASHFGIEDYLALDRDTGKLVHLHLHYRLVLGEKFLKGYRLPWERVLLAGRVLDAGTGVFTSAPEAELIVLLLRAALKMRTRNALGAGAPPGERDDLGREFRWLAERVDRDRLRALALELLGPVVEPSISAMLTAGPSRRALLDLRRVIRPVLEPYRGFQPGEARRIRWTREWRTRWARAVQRFFGRHQPLRHASPRGGVVVAFLGADGSGKSTITKAVGSWLGWKLEVVPIYFGFGDGPVSPVRKPLELLKRVYARRRRPGTPAGDDGRSAGESTSAPGRRWPPFARALWRLLYAWAVAREKRGRSLQAQRARHLGWIVVGDRYPQAQVMMLGDGPLLADWVTNRWSILRKVATLEADAYRRMEAVAPDLVIKLHVSPEVSARRKNDASLESLARRADTVRRIGFPAGTRVVDVDADQPLEKVLLRVKRVVWESL